MNWSKESFFKAVLNCFVLQGRFVTSVGRLLKTTLESLVVSLYSTVMAPTLFYSLHSAGNNSFKSKRDLNETLR